MGHRIFDVKGTKIAVMNFLGRTFMNPVDSPWEIIEKEIENIKQAAPIVIVDFHAEATAEKSVLADSVQNIKSVLFLAHIPMCRQLMKRLLMITRLISQTQVLRGIQFCDRYGV